MATIGVARLGVIIKLSHDKAVVVNEGDCVTGLRYVYNRKEYTLDGCVRVICARTSSYAGGPTTCPPEPYTQNYITPTKLIIDSSEEHRATLTEVNIADIIDIESVGLHGNNIVVGPGAEYKPLGDVVSAAEEGAVIELMPGAYEGDVVLNKDVTLVLDPDTELTGALTFTAGNAAVIGGKVSGPVTIGDDMTRSISNPVIAQFDCVEFTGDAKIVVNQGVDMLNIGGCTFGGHNMATGKKEYLIHVKGESEIQLNINDCMFNEEPKESYNLIEILGILKDGSSITGNYFNTKCVAHNCISIYNAVDGANILIAGNHYGPDVYKNRLGLKGNPQNVKITFQDNISDDPAPDTWAGLLMIQPYGSATESMAGVTLVFDNNDNKGNPFCYLYAGKSDTQWTADNVPTIYIDGEKIAVPGPLCEKR